MIYHFLGSTFFYGSFPPQCEIYKKNLQGSCAECGVSLTYDNYPVAIPCC